MPSTRSRAASITRPVVGIVQHGDAVIRHSKIPPPLRFPLVAVLSMTLSGLLYSLLADLTTAQLVNVIRRNESWLEVGALLGWRTLELALGWFGDYDGYDLASLTLLSHGPPLYLLASFYEVSSTAAILSLLIDAFATYIPFRLLRPLSAAHAASSSKQSPQVANKEIVINSSIQGLTTLLAANVYAITIYAACKIYLPIYLVTYFEDIPSIAAAHSADVITLLPLTLIIGFATRSFIFTPAVAAGDAPAAPFDPENASLGETFWYNVWGYSDRNKVVLKRTGTVMLVGGVNTFLHLLFTVEGVAVMGAVAYSGVWAVAAGFTGVALSFVSGA